MCEIKQEAFQTWYIIPELGCPHTVTQTYILLQLMCCETSALETCSVCERNAPLCNELQIWKMDSAHYTWQKLPWYVLWDLSWTLFFSVFGCLLTLQSTAYSELHYLSCKAKSAVCCSAHLVFLEEVQFLFVFSSTSYAFWVKLNAVSRK